MRPHQQVGSTVSLFAALVGQRLEFRFQIVYAFDAVGLLGIWEVGKVSFGSIVVVDGYLSFTAITVEAPRTAVVYIRNVVGQYLTCLLYTSDAADE